VKFALHMPGRLPPRIHEQLLRRKPNSAQNTLFGRKSGQSTAGRRRLAYYFVTAACLA
jgi:hypothetical protein